MFNWLCGASCATLTKQPNRQVLPQLGTGLVLAPHSLPGLPCRAPAAPVAALVGISLGLLSHWEVSATEQCSAVGVRAEVLQWAQRRARKLVKGCRGGFQYGQGIPGELERDLYRGMEWQDGR